MNGAVLGELTVRLALLSLLAVGGVNTILPEIHREVVDVHHWMTTGEFADMVALGQTAPGPNVLVATLIGWNVAGLAGAIAATLAMCGPPCLLTFAVVHIGGRLRQAPWRAKVRAGLAPVTVGLMIAGAWVVADAAATGWRSYVVTVATAVIVLTTRIHPLLLFAAAGALGILGIL